MSKKNLPHHDRLFKATLTNIERATEFLQVHLPDRVKKDIDFSKPLELVHHEFVNKELRALYSDVIYQCTLKGRPGYIYTLIEHQSKPDPLMPLRMLEYNFPLMRRPYKKHKTIPPILNLVLYHGKPSPYPFATNILELTQEHDMLKDTLMKGIHLIDLGDMEDDEITKNKKIALMELFLKHSREKNFFQFMKRMVDDGLMTVFFEQHDREYVTASIVYAINSINEKQHSAQDVVNLYQQVLPENLKQEAMTIAQGLEQKGVMEVAKRMIAKLVDLEFIREVTGLTQKQIEQLQKEL